MRKDCFAAIALSMALFVGCSAPVDSTVNRDDNTAGLTYPGGPYGYIEDSTIDNYKFLGKEPIDGVYETQALRELFLAEYYTDPSAKVLLITGSASWCYYCNEEAPTTERLAADKASVGFRALTVLAEGSTQGVPSNAEDLDRWIKKHKLKTGEMAIDPAQRMFQYASASAFPVHILVDAKTMTIRWLCVGGQGGCDTTGAVLNLLEE